MNYPPRAHGRPTRHPGRPVNVHSFTDYLEAENRESNAEWWQTVYEHTFGPIARMFICPRGGAE